MTTGAQEEHPIGVCGFVRVLTTTGAVVFEALLRVTFESTMEAMLPELWKPGVPLVVFRTKFQVVLVKPLHISRLELDGDTTRRFSNVAICYIVPVRPAVTAHTEKQGRIKKGGANHQFWNKVPTT